MQQAPELIVDHMKQKGWEMNPAKIQGPSQTVTVLGIQWHCGHREILPTARQKILDFAMPQNKKEAQKFIGLFGFWRHVPHLGQILAPLYKVMRKKYEFGWGSEQQAAFELAKEATQQALDLWPVQKGGVEFNVSVNGSRANWSLWQKDWKIYSKEVWGKELWVDIWEIIQRTKVTVFHVDAHSNTGTLERL